MRHCLLGLLCAVASVEVEAGVPSEELVQLRKLEVRRCERVTPANMASVSSFVKAADRSTRAQGEPAQVAGGTPGYLVEGEIKRQRDLAFPFLEGFEIPVTDTGWRNGAEDSPTVFFFPSDNPDACVGFAPGTVVKIVISQNAGCDTYPPEGVCAFDRPIRMAERELWARYGE